nr:MAG TPA: hypothetical protein [Caudoviricetes sp.]
MSQSQQEKKRYNNGTKLILVNEVLFTRYSMVNKTEPIYSTKPRLINASRIIDVEFRFKHFTVQTIPETLGEVFSNDHRSVDCSLIHLAGRSHNDRICVIETPEQIYNLIKEA